MNELPKYGGVQIDNQPKKRQNFVVTPKNLILIYKSR